MNSRERVQAALSFQEPDRVPVDIGGFADSNIHVDVYARLVEHLGMDFLPPKVWEHYQMLTCVDPNMLKYFGSDFITLTNPTVDMGMENKDWKIWRTNAGTKVLMPGGFNPEVDKSGYQYVKNAQGAVIAQMPPTGLYFDSPNFGGDTDLDEIEYIDPAVKKSWVPRLTDNDLRLLEKRAKFYYDNTDYAINGFFTNIGTADMIQGHSFSDWLCLVMLEPDYIASLIMAVYEAVQENLVGYLQAVGKYLDVIVTSDMDFASQTSPYMSTEAFDKTYIPAFKMVNNYVHKHSNAKTLFHCCGAARPLLNSLINAGFDIFNPVQTSAIGMDPTELKEEFGKRIVFWGGGMDIQTVFSKGTTEDVREEVKKKLKAFGPGGGYVFGATHNIQPDTPVENIMAMVETLHENWDYPISIK